MSTQTTPPEKSKPSKSTIKDIDPWKWVKEHKLYPLLVVPIVGLTGFMSNVGGVYELAEKKLGEWQFEHVTGSIKDPLDEAAVPAKVTFEGDISELPKDTSLWLFIYAGGIKKYYPYEIQPDAKKGNWHAQDIEIGMPNAHRGDFRAELFLVDQDKSDEFRQKVNRKMARSQRGDIKERGLDVKPKGKELAVIDIHRAAR